MCGWCVLVCVCVCFYTYWLWDTNWPRKFSDLTLNLRDVISAGVFLYFPLFPPPPTNHQFGLSYELHQKNLDSIFRLGICFRLLVVLGEIVAAARIGRPGRDGHPGSGPFFTLGRRRSLFSITWLRCFCQNDVSSLLFHSSIHIQCYSSILTA